MKKALRKNFYMEIRHSLGRFISIFFIVAIGCAFFSGIRASEPDMRYSGDAYFDEKNLMDIQVMSTMGLTEDDLDAIRAVDGVLDAEGSYATDVLCTIRGNQVAVHVMALQDKMNQVQLEDGRLPEKENECVIDADYLDGKNLKVGDKITLSSGTSDSLEDTLKTDTFTIVGTVSSPEYIAFHRGSTTIGNGSVSAFLCVPEKAFSLDVYTEITVQVEGAKEATAFTKEYEEHVDSVLKKVQAIKAEREQARYDEITSTAQEKVDEAQEELAQAEQDLADGKEEAEEELASAREKLDAAQKELERGRNQLAASKLELEQSRNLLISKQKELEHGWAVYEEGRIEAQKKIEDGERQITEAREELAKAQQKIDDLEKPKWYVYDRNNLTEYSGYGDNADRMRAIGKVFPLIFFLVAALISLTTMTRMVEEERTQIGILKALGYGNASIVGKYLWYAILATLTGGVFGILIGEKIIPYIIITAYKILYRHMHDVVIPYNLYYAVTACAAALACTVIATLFSCMKELREQAAELMRPPTPKQGKRVFLERVPFIWKNLNFTWKSTVRNLVRYKKRFFMTVFGIGGCMGMMLFGFGLKDSISAIVPLQYEQIQLYDGDVILKEDVTEEERIEVQKELDTDKKVSVTAENLLKNIEVSSGESSQEVYLDVPKDVEAFKKFVVIRDRKTKEIYSLDDKGAILTEKVAKLLEVNVGDKLTIDTDDGEKTVLISAICENYMGHYLYMTSEVYEKTFGEAPAYNSIYYRTQDRTTEEAKDVGENTMRCDGTLSISYTTSLKKQVDHMLESLDIVIIVLIISAGMLAFVVLYNLNNINITERKRELATLKVLGFYDKEVSSYVYRENILLTLIGALAGLLIGKILHRFIIETVEIDSVMFGRNIDPPSFLYAFLLTVAFSLFVNGVMYFKLKKINMVESLKSVE